VGGAGFEEFGVAFGCPEAVGSVGWEVDAIEGPTSQQGYDGFVMFPPVGKVFDPDNAFDTSEGFVLLFVIVKAALHIGAVNHQSLCTVTIVVVNGIFVAPKLIGFWSCLGAVL
jgi:hypothetical protein